MKPLKLFKQTKQTFVRSEVFTAITMKNVVLWDIKTNFVLHGRHITSLLQSSISKCYVRFEVFTAVTVKNRVLLGYYAAWLL
jgi:hypothetical protein